MSTHKSPCTCAHTRRLKTTRSPHGSPNASTNRHAHGRQRRRWQHGQQVREPRPQRARLTVAERLRLTRWAKLSSKYFQSSRHIAYVKAQTQSTACPPPRVALSDHRPAWRCPPRTRRGIGMPVGPATRRAPVLSPYRLCTLLHSTWTSEAVEESSWRWSESAKEESCCWTRTRCQENGSHKFVYVDARTDEIGHATSLLFFVQKICHTCLGRPDQAIAKSERKADTKSHGTRGAKAEQQ